MNINTVSEIYDSIEKKKKGMRYSKVDLHIHTPASTRCYKPKVSSEDELKREYLSILDNALNNELSIIAITDHNTFKGYFELKRHLNSLENPHKYTKRMLILPGIEITNFGKHILAIFPPEKNPEENTLKALNDKFNTFLMEIGIAHELQGEEKATADKVAPLQLLSKIAEYGGIVIPAHVDANKGILEDYLGGEEEAVFTGTFLNNILISPHLYGLQLNNKNYKEKISNKLRTLNKERDLPLPLLYFSDSHSSITDVDEYTKSKISGKPMGTNNRFTYIRLSKWSFNGLKLALREPESRVFEDEPIFNHPHIVGISIKGGFIGGKKGDWQHFRFNENLNTIIGARGTGKSTLLKIVLYMLDNVISNNEEDLKDILRLFDEAIMYLRFNDSIYAIYKEPLAIINSYVGTIDEDTTKVKIYEKNGNKPFEAIKRSTLKKELRFFSKSWYKQKEIFQLADSKQGLLKIIHNYLLSNYETDYVNTLSEIKERRKKLDKIIRNYEAEKVYEKKEVAEKLLRKASKSFLEIVDLDYKISRYRHDLVNKLNTSLEGRVKLFYKKYISENDFSQLVKETVRMVREKHNIIEEEQIWLRRILTRIVENFGVWNLPHALVTSDFTILVSSKVISEEDAQRIKDYTQGLIEPSILSIFQKGVVDFTYNVNEGLSRKEHFVPRQNLSAGQKTVATLLLILNAGEYLKDSTPLIIDQPEDDLDNVYIYTSLVKEIKRNKISRQLLFATHNANIPVLGDAENIMVLKSDGFHGEVFTNGSIDNSTICKEVADLLEGGIEAFKIRSSKYRDMVNI